METNYTLKNLIRGGTLLLFFLAFMLTGPQSAEAQAPTAIVELEVVIDGPPGSTIDVYKSPTNVETFVGPVTATLEVSTGQLIRFVVHETDCIEFVEWEDVGFGTPDPDPNPDYDFTFTMPATTGATLKAVYQNVGHLLTAVADPPDNTVEITSHVVGTTTATVACTEQFTVVATATPGWTFSSFSVDDPTTTLSSGYSGPVYGTGTGSGYLELDMPGGIVTVTANFVKYTYTMATTGTGGGTITPTGTTAQTAGTTVNIQAAPDAESRFFEWESTAGNIFADPTDANTSFTMPEETHTVTATFDKKHLLTVVVDNGAGNEAGIESGSAVGSVTGTYFVDDTINLIAIATTGYTFEKWEISGGSIDDPSANQAVFTMPDDVATVTAVFSSIVTLTLAADDVNGANEILFNGTDVSGDLTVDYQLFEGKDVTLVAIAKDGWTFTGWDYDTGVITETLDESPGIGTFTFEMPNQAVTVTATFAKYTLTAIVDDGVTGDASNTVLDTEGASYTNGVGVRSGTQTTLVATAADGWTFTGWTSLPNAASLSADVQEAPGIGTFTFTMPNESVTVTATFAEYTLTTVVDDGVSGDASNTVLDVDGTTNYDTGVGVRSGTQTTLVATAADGWTFTGWDYVGIVSPTDVSVELQNPGTGTLTFTMPDDNVTVTATFEEYKITAEQDGHGSITVNEEVLTNTADQGPNDKSVRSEDPVAVVIQAEDGWTITGYGTTATHTEQVDPTSGTVTLTFTGGMPNTNATVTATFNNYRVITDVKPSANDGELFVFVNGVQESFGTPDAIDVRSTHSVDVVAVADPGYNFIGWERAGLGFAGGFVAVGPFGVHTETFTMPMQNVSFRAEFALAEELELIVEGNGSVDHPDYGKTADQDNTPLSYPVSEGVEVTLIATPESDEWTFTGWEYSSNITPIDNLDAPGIGTFTFTMPVDGATVTATFERFTVTTIVADGVGGTVDHDGEKAFRVGEPVTVVANADEANGYTFEKFEVAMIDGDVVVWSGTYTDENLVGPIYFWNELDGGVATLTYGTMLAYDFIVTVTFVQYNLALVTDDVEGLDQYLPAIGSQEGPITSGKQVVIQAIADENWVFDKFLIDGSPIDFEEDGQFESVGTATFTMPAGNVTLTAQFIKYNKLVLVVVDDEGGQFIGDYTDVHYFPPSTTEVPIEVVADANYQLVGITAVDGLLAGGDPLPAAGGVYTVTFDHGLLAGGVVTVTAQFAQDIDLTTVVDPEGAGTIDIELIAPIAPAGGTITEPAGSHIKLTATPAGVDEWVFVEWVFEPALAPGAIIAGSLTDDEIEIVVPSIPTTVTARFRPFYDIRVEGPNQICISQNAISDEVKYTFFTDLASPDFASFIWEVGPDTYVQSISGLTTATATVQWKIQTQNVPGSTDGTGGTFVRVRAKNAAGDEVARSDFFPVGLFIDIDGLTVTEPAPFCPETGSTTVDVSIVPGGAQTGVRTTGSSNWHKEGGPGELTIVEATPDVFGESYTISDAPAPGIYTYTYTAINGSCSESTTVVFEVFDLVDGVEIDVFPTAPICFDGTADFAATVSVTNTGVSDPTFDYAWTVDGAPFGINSSSFTFDAVDFGLTAVNTPTMFDVMVTVTQNDGCVAVVTDVFEIEVWPKPEFTPVIPAVATNHYCYDSFLEVTLDGKANLYYSATATTTFTYVLVGQDFVETTTTTHTYNIDDITIEFGPLTPGSYTLTVTVNNHYCETTADPVNFHVYEKIDDVVITEVVDAICWDKDFVFTATPTFSTFGIEAEEEPTYSWYVDGSQELTGVGESEFTFDANVYAAGITDTTTYDVTVVALDFCGITTVTYSQSISVNPQPVIFFTFGGVAIEEGGVVSTCFNSTDVFAIEKAYGEYPFYIEAYVTNGVGLVTKTIDSGDEFLVEDLLGVGFEPGKYDVTINKIVDDNGCEVANPHLYYNFELNIHPEPVIIFAFNNEEITEGKDLGTVCWNEDAADLYFTVLYTEGKSPFTVVANVVDRVGFVTDTTFSVTDDPTWSIHLTEFIAAADLNVGTHTVVLTSITDDFGCNSESTASYTFTIDIQAKPFATIDVPTEVVCADADVSLSLDFDPFNVGQIGGYTVTWTVSALGVTETIVGNTPSVVFNSYDLLGIVTQAHTVTVEAHIENASCEYTTVAVNYDVRGLPYIIKNAIQTPAHNVFCSSVPAGITIFGEDDVVWGEIPPYQDCDPVYKWRRRVSNDGGVTYGQWTSTGDAADFGRDYVLPGLTKTTQYRRLVRLENCVPCGEDIYNYDVTLSDESKWYASNIVTMYVLDADHFDTDITTPGIATDYVIFTDGVTVGLEATAIPEFATGLWTWVPTTGLLIDPVDHNIATATASAPGSYDITWKIIPDANVNVSNCLVSKGNVDDVTIIFEEITVDPLVINDGEPFCANAAPVDIDVEALISIIPADGTYDYVLEGEGIVDDTFNPALAGAGSHLITLTVTSDQIPTYEVIVTTTVVVNEEPFVGFSFNDVLVETDEEYTYCFNTTITATLSHIWGGTAPFEITWTVTDENDIVVDAYSGTETVNDGGELFSGILDPGTYTVEVTSIVDANGCEPTDLTPYMATVTVYENITYTEPTDHPIVDACDFADQVELDAAFDAWIAGILTDVEGGENPQVSHTVLGPIPHPCDGGSVDVLWTIDDRCGNFEYTVTFEVTPATPVAIAVPDNVSDSSCLFEDQADLNTVFAAWIAAFEVTEAGCGVTVPDLSGYSAPVLCDGGIVTVEYSINDGCSSASETRTFEIIAPPAVAVAGPANVDASRYDFVDQDDLDDQFAAWIAAFEVTEDGCGVELPDLDIYEAPSICVGGEVEVIFAVEDLCTDASITRTFKVTSPEVAVGFSFGDDLADTGDSFTYCFDETIVVTLSDVWEGVAPFYIEWTDGVDTYSGTFSEGDVLYSDNPGAGTYVIEITSIVDAQGCEPSDYAPYTATVVVNPEPAVLFAVNGDVVYGGQILDEYCFNTPITVTLDQIVTGAGPLQSLEWTVHFNEELNEDLSGDVTGVTAPFGLFGPEELAAGTYFVQLTELIDANGCEPASLEDYNFTLVIRPEPVANIIGVPASNEICHNTILGLNLAHVAADFGDEYTVTWHVNGQAFPVANSTEFELVGEDWGIVTVATDVTIFVGISNEWGCTYVTDPVTITILGRPEITRNIIATPAKNIYCGTIPAGEKIVGDGVVLFTTGNPNILTENVVVEYRWQYSIAGPTGPWFSFGETFEPGDRDLILENITETTWFRRQVRLENGGLCDLYPAEQHTSNVVVMRVLESGHFDLDPILATPNVCLGGEIGLQANLPLYATGEWTIEGPGDLTFEIGSEISPIIVVQASVAGEYKLTWTIEHDNNVHGGCPGDGSYVEKTIIFEELELAALDFNGEFYCADDDTVIEIDLDVTMTLVPAAGDYTAELFINDVLQDNLTFVPSVLGEGVHTIKLVVETAIGCTEEVEATVTVNTLLAAPDTTPVVVCIDGEDHGFIIAPAPADHILVYWDEVADEWSDELPEFSAAGAYEITVKYVREAAPFCEGPEATAELVIQSLTLDNVVANFGVAAEACAEALDAVTLDLPIPVAVPDNVVVTEELALNGDQYPLNHVFDLSAPGVYNFVYAAQTAGGCIEVQTATVEVFALPPAPVVADVVVYFDNTAKEFDVEEAPADHTLEWAATADGVFTDDDLPTYTDAGEYSIWVRFVADTAPFCVGPAVEATLEIRENIVIDEDTDVFMTAMSIFVTWTDETGHDKYMVRLTEVGDKDYSVWFEVTETEVLFEDLKPATEYLFEVKADPEDASKDDTIGFASVEITTLSKGDVNADGAVNISDIVAIVQYITDNLGDRVVIDDASELAETEATLFFIFDAADMNDDGEIDIFDIVRIVNTMNNADKQGTMNSESAQMRMAPDQISLESDGTLTALQFELIGSNLEDVKLSTDLFGLQIAWKVDGDVLTAIVFSVDNQLIDAGKSVLINIEGGRDIEWGNAYASNLYAEKVEVNVTYTLPTSIIDNFTTMLSLDVFPNPSSGQFTSRVDVPVNSNITFRLYDLSGRQVAIQQLEGTSGVEDVSWNLDLNPGMYILRMVATPQGLTEQAVTREVRVIIN